MGFRVQGLGFWVLGLGFWAKGFGFRVLGFGWTPSKRGFIWSVGGTIGAVQDMMYPVYRCTLGCMGLGFREHAPPIEDGGSYELSSKLLVSPLITPIILPYRIPYIYGPLVRGQP